MDELVLLKELIAIGLAGVFYSKDVFDTERYERIQAIAKQLIAQRSNLTREQLDLGFDGEYGYQTPKVDTRAVVWRDGKILLVQEADGRWALPGGWMDVTETLTSNALKELWEEAGVVGQAKRLIMIQDRNLHNPGHSPLTILKCFIECDYQTQNFQANVETQAAKFFAPDDLPELFEAKSSYQQIALCHEAYQEGERWQVLID